MHVHRIRTVALATLLAVGLVVPVGSPALADDAISTRVDDGDPVASAVTISGIRFPSATDAAHVVVSRRDVFADSLAGAPLLGDGPLLLTDTGSLSGATRTELRRLHQTGKRAYVLGGVEAVADTTARAIADLGYEVVRLAGATRVETSLAIADQVRALRGGGSEVLLARARGSVGSPGSGWVDSVAGGAWAAEAGLPVLLTSTASMEPAVADWLRTRGIATTRLLGGPVALSDAVEGAAPGAVRHWGQERSGTAAAIARELWGARDTGSRTFTVVNGTQDRGWAFGLAAAGLAADRNAPVLLALDTVTDATRRLVATCGTPEVDLTIIGDGTLVSGAVREYLDDLDGEGCGPDRTLRRSPRLRSFDSCPDLLEWYRTNALERVTAYGLDSWYEGGPVVMPVAEADAQDAPAAAPQESGAAGDDVSGTNVQEVGVDEPDIVKTDGSLAAVVLHDGSTDLVDLTGLTPDVVANIPAANEYGHTELLLHGDVLTTLTTTFGFDYFAEDAVAPGVPGRQSTTVTRWDVSDPSDPTELSSFETDGAYRSARMIDGVARIVIESYAHDLDFTYPEDGSDEAHDRALAHNRQVVKDSVLANWLPSWGAGGNGGDGPLLVDCRDVHQPPVWSGFTTVSVVTFDTATDSEPGATASVVASGENVYASTDRLLVTTGRWGNAFEDEQLDSIVSTEVHAFDITDPDDIDYTGSGSVNGFVINQFALSEFEGDIRIAATIQPPWQDEQAQTESFVAVLREQGGALTEVGRVGGLGRNERIQSVRFQGDLGIVVTFRQIDPLYLVDLSDGTNPRVTGELKDTGFAQYLHRVGEDQVVGVGVHADDNGNVLGAMVALYDISDRSRPTRVDRYTVLDAQSPVGFDHRAFLHWTPTGDAFVPITSYGNEYREVAAVLRVGDGTLTHRGDLDHEPNAGNPAAVRRSFVVGSNVYTVSYAGLARHDLNSLTTTSWTTWTR